MMLMNVSGAIGWMPKSLAGLIWEPVVPPILILIAVGALLGLAFRTTVWTGRRSASPTREALTIPGRWGLLLLRSVAILILGLLLMNPVRDTTTTAESAVQSSRPLLHILIDDSQSMGTRDVVLRGTEGATLMTRFEALQKYWLAPDFLTTLADGVKPVFYRVGRELERVTAEELPMISPESKGSRIAEHLRALLRSPGIEESAGILLLSDGRDTSGEALGAVGLEAAQVGDGGVPIYVVPIGNEEVPADLAVYLIAEDTDVYQGQMTTLHAELRQHGYTDRIVDVVLQQNGVEIERRRLRLEGSSERLQFEITPTGERKMAGMVNTTGMVDFAEYTLAVEPFPGEQIQKNNFRHAFIRIHDERIRVALFENGPYWDTRFLIQALRADPRIELTTFIGINDRIETVARYEAAATGSAGEGEGGGEVVSGDEPLDPLGVGSGSAREIVVPTNLAELIKYDVVILGQGIERWFPAAQAGALVDFVIEGGGSLIFARGAPCRIDHEEGRRALEILEEVSPITWGAERLVAAGTLVSTVGGRQRGPIDFEALGETDRILTRLPGMLAQTEIQREKAFSMIWLRSRNSESTFDDESDGVPPGTGAVANEPAAVAHFRAGRGQSLAILTHGLWQWALLPPAQDDLAGAFQFFWHRCIRWLAGGGELLPGQSVSLRLDRLSAEPGEMIELSVQTRFINPAELSELTVYSIWPSGEEHQIALTAEPGNAGRLVGRMLLAEEGIHRMVLKTPFLKPNEIERRFAVQASDRELIDPSLDREALKLLAKHSSGVVFQFDDPELVFGQMRISHLARGLQKNPTAAWATLAAYLGLVFAFGGEWILRRRHGMA